MTKLASVIIPHHNDPIRLKRCLKGLSENALLARTEIIVVENGKIRLTKKFKSRHPNITFIHEARAGAAHARNAGVAASHAPLLFFLDCDCVPGPQWLTFALTAAMQHDITGGAVDLFDETHGPRSGAQAFETVFAFQQEDYIATKGFSVTANLVTRREIFEHVGPFHDGVSEDVEWCHRAGNLGYEINYKPQLRVKHPTRSDWAKLKAKWHRVTREMHQLNQCRFKWAARAIMLPISAIVHIPKVAMSKKLTSLRDRRLAIMVLLKLRLWRAGHAARLALGGQLRA